MKPNGNYGFVSPLIPKIQPPSVESKVEMYRVELSEPPPDLNPERHRKTANQIDRWGMEEYDRKFPWKPQHIQKAQGRIESTMVGSLTARSQKLKAIAAAGNWPAFQALGGTMEEFRAIRERLPNL